MSTMKLPKSKVGIILAAIPLFALMYQVLNSFSPHWLNILTLPWLILAEILVYQHRIAPELFNISLAVCFLINGIIFYFIGFVIEKVILKNKKV